MEHPSASVAVARGGELVATASKDRTARLWNSPGDELAMLRGHELPLRDANFSPDGALVVTASHDGTARLWKLAGEQVALLAGHTGPVRDAAFGPSGARVVTASEGGTARVFPVYSTDELIERALAVLPRTSLSPAQRERFSLAPLR